MNFPLQRNSIVLCLGILIAISSSCESPVRENIRDVLFEENFQGAIANGLLANEGFRRCENYKNAWLSFADPKTKLVPRRLNNPDDLDIWNAWDCAADNYPFLVLTSFFTNRNEFEGVMKEMLRNETRLTSRVGSLPDTYSFSRGNFEFDSMSMERIIFGTAEYMKDGLLPLTEWLGQSPWSERMMNMLRDLNNYVDVSGKLDEKNFGKAPEAEVNGELLQILSRMYWMTGDASLLKWATQIGDYFLLGDGYPLSHHDYLRLRDHGCELVAGLCELYATVHFADRKKKNDYQESLHRLLDFILAHGRNEDGLFYNAINPKTGKIIDEGLADTWGYTLNGFYSVYLVDSVQRYEDAVRKVFSNLSKYRNYNWEMKSADGFADAIEGAINLYNRVADKDVAEWINSEIKIMWSMQDSSHREDSQRWRNSGIIEGWYGDGNFARTTIMYNLWKSQGTYVLPWSPDLNLGASQKNDTLVVALTSENPWNGKLYFDKTRHAAVMKMPIDWPRINQFPEWFTVDPEKNYHVLDKKGALLYSKTGDELLKGLDVKLESSTTLYLAVSKN